MKCPHCQIAFHDVAVWRWYRIFTPQEIETNWICQITVCPSCDNPIIKLAQRSPETGLLTEERLIHPASPQRAPVDTSVPEGIRQDYIEACQALPLSAKASAALSRRVLQAILRDQGYTNNNLYQQIDGVLKENDPKKTLPQGLHEIIDAIRQFGNFSAHPITDVTSLQVIDVEPEEAEWSLEIIVALFEHYYVGPAKSKSKMDALNKKLRRAGKPPVKS